MNNEDYDSLDELFEQEMEDDDDLNVTFALHGFFDVKEREPKWYLPRLNWIDHVQREIHAKSFELKYHMRLDSFNKLVETLRPFLEVDKLQSVRSTGGRPPIAVELVVGMGLRYLGGELIKSLEDIFGAHQSYIRSYLIPKFLGAVDSVFSINLPTTTSAKQSLADEFSSLSTADGLFHGVIGALDGWLCCTTQPIDTDIINKRDYFSGHYQKFGLNVQAMCDARLRFIYFAVAAPGKTNDSRAVLKCESLCRWLDSLEDTDHYIVGDNAYVLRDECLIPFSGNSVSEVNRTYNFFLSQLRIRIEMAFGRLTTKWRIFRRDLDHKMENVSLICRAAAKLHNYVIDESLTTDDEIEIFDGAPRGMGYLPMHPENADEEIVENGQVVVPVGFSARRIAIVEQIGLTGLCRPSRNILRNG